MPRLEFSFAVFLLLYFACFAQETSRIPGQPSFPQEQQQQCDTGPGIFWPVFLTLFFVFVILGAAYLFWRYYWNVRHGKHLVLVTDLEKGEPEFAFDNPGFKEGTPALQKKIQEPKKTKWVTINENNVEKLTNGSKPRSSDDSTTHSEVEQTMNVVPLKSHDFTGLGFNICGNMRDGIFVKDLLHHGPASQSGHIKSGDRIAAVRINFSHMVYEDAMSILSYASPYEVEVEIENSKAWSPGSFKSVSNSTNSDNITHPFYRSQSFSDAQQIQKTNLRNQTSNTVVVSQPTTYEQPAVLEISQNSEKMSKYGVKVLPDIKPGQLNSFNIVKSETQQSSATPIHANDNKDESNKISGSGFDEVDLSRGIEHNGHVHSEKSGDGNQNTKETNMKSFIVKGLQNIKDKINSHIHHKNSGEKNVEKSNDMVLQESDTKNEPKEYNVRAVENGTTIKNNIPLRQRLDSNSSNEGDGKKSKRKAPLPPAGMTINEMEYGKEFGVESSLLNEIQSEVNKNFENHDSDSEKDVNVSNRIELNSSHITVHHVPEDSNRKAASLGDLSKIVDSDVSNAPLERAVSLELTDTPHEGRKRKAPLPPHEDSVSDDVPFEPNLESSCLNTTLKKSSLFGTLEEAIKQSDEDNASMLSIPDEIIASTPMKQNEEMKSISPDSSSNNSWELNFDLQENKDLNDVFLPSIDDSDAVPALPTSPIPILHPYVTEITVTNIEEPRPNKSEMTLFVTATETSASDDDQKSENNQTYSDNSKYYFLPINNKSSGKTPDSKLPFNGSNEMESHMEKQVLNIVNNKPDFNRSDFNHSSYDGNETSGIHTKVEIEDITESQLDSENHTPQYSTSPDSGNQSSSEYSISSSNFKFSKENLSDEQILALKTSAISTTPLIKYNKMNGDNSVSKLKSPTSVSKLPKLIATSPTSKVAGSRIPVRANTEPSLRIPLSIKEENIASKLRKHKTSEENGETKSVTFSGYNLSSPRKSLSPTRYNGPNRESSITHIVLENRK